jgi:hypothetical protein
MELRHRERPPVICPTHNKPHIRFHDPTKSGYSFGLRAHEVFPGTRMRPTTFRARGSTCVELKTG